MWRRFLKAAASHRNRVLIFGWVIYDPRCALHWQV
jgi:hypothetical protein